MTSLPGTYWTGVQNISEQIIMVHINMTSLPGTYWTGGQNIPEQIIMVHINMTSLSGTYWTGGQNTAVPGTAPEGFKWLSTGEVFTDTNWFLDDPRQPSGTSGEMCVVVDASTRHRWADRVCTSVSYPFVCEW